MVDPLSYFSFQPVFHDWCNKGRGMCYLVCGMVHIKEPLLHIGKSSPCGGSGFLSRYPNSHLQYIRRHITVNVVSTSLNKNISFLPVALSCPVFEKDNFIENLYNYCIMLSY